MAQNSKSRKLDQYIVRFPDGMRDELKAAAEKNNRSLNSEIVARIEWSKNIVEMIRQIEESETALFNERLKIRKLENQLRDFIDDNGNTKPILAIDNDLYRRIEIEAGNKRRSVNEEAVNALELTYPPPPNLDETIQEIKRYVELMGRMRGPTMLAALADSLDSLMLQISLESSVAPQDRKAAKKLVEKQAKFSRFVPPDGDY